MVTSPFVIYRGSVALDVRKATMWSVTTGDLTKKSCYVRGTPEVPIQAVGTTFDVAKQADCDAAAFVR
jgi:hypothetical protein